MSTKYLGETFDIHGGGMDLKFPHHECEIAQAKGAVGKDPVKYWMHSNMLTVNGQKMSKSLGNSFLPSELFSGTHKLLDRGYSPMTVRFFMLQSHYSSTLDFSNDALAAAEKGFKKLTASLMKIKKETGVRSQGSGDAELTNTLNSLVDECYRCMSDDFNTAKTLAVLFEMSSRINVMQVEKVDGDVFEKFKSTYVGFMEDVLGFKEETNGDDRLLDGTIKVLIELRKKARVDRNYALSDRIRDDLKMIGIQLKDGKDGEISYNIE
jgi:cysteinyl-tRNA synthetase